MQILIVSIIVIIAVFLLCVHIYKGFNGKEHHCGNCKNNCKKKQRKKNDNENI